VLARLVGRGVLLHLGAFALGCPWIVDVGHRQASVALGACLDVEACLRREETLASSSVDRLLNVAIAAAAGCVGARSQLWR
jgi:hypothetical protein